MENINRKNVEKFWIWFEENKGFLMPDKITKLLINKLNEKILELGNFNWEIREGIYKDNMLIISPGGDINLLNLTKEIIQSAPEITGWEFYHYKPSKQWDFKLSLYELFNLKKTLDVKDWEYVLYSFSDGTFDIVLKASNLTSMSENEKNIIIDIVLESILGEEESLNLIKKIDIVNEFGDSEGERKSSIKHLKNHIEQLIKM